MRCCHFWIVGGDQRQGALARALVEDGHRVHTFALGPEGLEGASPGDLSGIREADCVVLGLPAEDGPLLNAPLAGRSIPLSEVLDAMAPGQLLCAGRASSALQALSQDRQLRLQDYFAREELAIANAVPTSEGAIQIAMEELPITLHSARCLVIGSGRLGKVLVRQLQGLGAKVSVAARKYADLAWAQVWGCGVERSEELVGWLCAYDLIVNTVPAPVLGREELTGLKPGCLIIDLASKPGGVDFDAAADLGVRVIWALSLPGKAAPVTAALAVKATLYNILRERGA